MEPTLPTLVLPGGRLPHTAKDGDVGYDCYVRAVVRAKMCAFTPYQRGNIWTLCSEPPHDLVNNAAMPLGDKGWQYVLRPGESVLLGLGIVFGKSNRDWSAHIVPRSSKGLEELGIKSHLNSIPIDPNFHAEPVVFLSNYSSKPFYFGHGEKLVQIEFTCKCCGGKGRLMPELKSVASYALLGVGPRPPRGVQCHGSSDNIVKLNTWDFDPQIELPLKAAM